MLCISYVINPFKTLQFWTTESQFKRLLPYLLRLLKIRFLWGRNGAKTNMLPFKDEIMSKEHILTYFTKTYHQNNIGYFVLVYQVADDFLI